MKTFHIRFKVDGNDRWFSFMPLRGQNEEEVAQVVRDYYDGQVEIIDMVIEEV